MKCIFSVLLVFLFLNGPLAAQKLKLSGTVRDAKDNSTLIGAVVALSYAVDTTQASSTVTDNNGAYRYGGLYQGTYRIKITYIGYAPLIRYLKMDSVNKDIGVLKMEPEGKTFGTITVEAKAIAVQQKNDTTEYNASTYKTNPDATAEDLVNKMPGITSANGTVTAHGETVQKVLVDGREFFGDDATATLKNLPADVVDKVQVYDRLSDQAAFTGFDDGNSQKTINITTKKGRNNGVFGKIYTGYGYLTDSRYSVGGNLNWFNGTRRLSLVGMSNDINQQNFASQDLLGVQSGRGGGNSNNFMVGQQGGINTTTSIGLNYVDVWGKKQKVKVAGSWFFNQQNNTTITSLTRQYYLSHQASSLYNENDSSRSINRNQRLNMRIEYTIDTNNSIIFTPKFIYQQNTQYYNLAGQTVLDSKELSHTASNRYAYNSGYQISGDVLYQHKFAKKFRTFSIDIGTTINNKQGNGSQNSFSYYDTTQSTVPLNQQYISYNHSYNANASLSLTEPVGEKAIMQLNYSTSYTWNTTNQQTDTLNRIDNKYSLIDTILSDRYTNTYFTQRIGLTYRYHDQHTNTSLGLNAQEAILNGTNAFPYSYTTALTFRSLLPTAMFNYKFGNTSTLRIFFRTATSPPSISQLQNVINNTNPLLLSTGNPALDQSYNSSLNIRYGFAQGPKGQSFFAFANISNTAHYVTNSTIIANRDTFINQNITLHRGSQFTQPVNINGFWSANSYLSYGVAVEKIKCNFNLTTGFNYVRTPGLINNALSLSNSYAPTGGLTISSNISEAIDYTITYSGTYNIIKNTIQTATNNNYFNHSASAKFNWLFWKGFVFNTSLQNTYYQSTTQGFNQNIFLWNLSLGYKFLKNKALDVRASINDVLNQNSGLSRTINQTFIEDDRTQIIKRYMLITVTWTLKYYKGPMPTERKPREGGPMPPGGGNRGGGGGNRDFER